VALLQAGDADIGIATEALDGAPDIVMSALDSDVIKTYVELGLGIGIVASVAFNAERDRGLLQLESFDLFEENVTRIAVRQGHYLRGYAYQFIEACSPRLTEAHVRPAINPARDADD